MDIIIDDNGVIQKTNDGNDNISMHNVMVRTRNNYAYEEDKMKKDVDYINLYRITKNMKYDIEDSHDVVAYVA